MITRLKLFYESKYKEPNEFDLLTKILTTLTASLQQTANRTI
jgi:hypothetical protein